MEERRAFTRILFIKEVEVVGVGVRRCSDISVGGIYLENVSPFPVGTVLKLRFKIRDTDRSSIEVEARVQYAHEGLGMGLVFVSISPEDRSRLQTYFDLKQNF